MIEKATFAAGCFWGVQECFRHLTGVTQTIVGYTGGHTKNPSYQMVCKGQTGHAEAIEITYDSEQIRYEQLLNTFWQQHDPTSKNRQGPDVGSQYRSAIFYHSEQQQMLAIQSLNKQQKYYSMPIVTEIVPAGVFYLAEPYHQHYIAKQKGEI